MPHDTDYDDRTDTRADRFLWAALFILFGLLVMWNPPPAGQGRYFVAGGIGVGIGTALLIRAWLTPPDPD